MITRKQTAYFRWEIIQPTLPVYASRTASKALLNLAKKRPITPFEAAVSSALRSIPQSAGVKVSATRAEIATDTVMVIANCL